MNVAMPMCQCGRKYMINTFCEFKGHNTLILYIPLPIGIYLI